MSNILLVDDEPHLLKAFSLMLDGEGYEIFTANDGLQALEVLDDEAIDLVITDALMPNLDGVSLIKKSSEANPSLRYLMVTGSTNIEDCSCLQNLRERMPTLEVLSKPVRMSTLRETVSRTLR